MYFFDMLQQSIPLDLAIFDIVPNIFFLLGILTLYRYEFSGKRPVIQGIWIIGGIGVFLGGMCKVIWKILMAGWNVNVLLFSDQLFVTQSIGFTLMCIVVWFHIGETLQNHQKPPLEIQSSMLHALIPILLMVAWKIPFLILQVLMAIATYIGLIILAIKRKKWSSVGLWGLSLVLMIGMSQLAQQELSIEIQWIAETTNVLGQLVYYLAAVVYGK